MTYREWIAIMLADDVGLGFDVDTITYTNLYFVLGNAGILRLANGKRNAQTVA